MRLRAYIAALLFAAPALADGISGYVEENYSHTSTRISDETRVRTQDQDELVQRYRVNLDRSFWPLLRFMGTGSFDQVNDWRTGFDAGSGWTRLTGGYATLTAGNTFLNAGAGYNLQVLRDSSQPYSLYLQEPSFQVGWRPSDLPSLSVRVSRQHIYDTTHLIEDSSTVNGLLASTWKVTPRLNLQYTAGYQKPNDAITETESQQVTQLFRADWLDPNFVQNRATAGAGVQVTDRRTQVTSAGKNGTLVTLQTPLAALFAVEKSPATSELVTLAPFPTLIDGNSTAATTIDLGAAPALANDRDARDLGLQFQDLTTQVNTIYVWVNQQLPETIWRSYRWTAWKSDDNLHWTQLPIAGAVIWGGVFNRFEITIEKTAATYIKVVTHPLEPTAAANDPRFTNIFVTEVQSLLTTPATATGWQGNSSYSANANFRSWFLTRDLVYDFSGFYRRTVSTGQTSLDTYLLSNGLAYTRRLTTALLFTSRVAWLDQNLSNGRQDILQYSASLAATPMPTLGSNLVYSGQSTWAPAGFTNLNTVSLYNRAIPYRGISLLAGGSYNVITSPGGQVQRGTSLIGTATIQPHPSLSFSGTARHDDSVTTGGSRGRDSTVNNRLDGNVSWTPFPALYVAGGVSYLVQKPGSSPETRFNGSASVSPFPGGDIQMGVSYSETYQQGGSQPGARNRLFVPNVRWIIRTGTLLTVSYTVLDSTAPPSRTIDRTFNVNLQIAL